MTKTSKLFLKKTTLKSLRNVTVRTGVRTGLGNVTTGRDATSGCPTAIATMCNCHFTGNGL
jgi:hypothetical protein